MSDPLIDESAEFGLLVADIFDAAGVLRRFGEQIASAAGQTQARWQLLSVVSIGEWSVPMAAERLGTSRQAVQRIANELIDEDLITLVENPRHRRSALLQLTADGRKTLETITAQAHLRHAALLTGLSAPGLAKLRSALRDLTTEVRSTMA